jgi:hypothetical protein
MCNWHRASPLSLLHILRSPTSRVIIHLSEQLSHASYVLKHAGERASKHELAHLRAAPLAEIFDGEHRAPAVAIEDDLL